MSIEPKKDLVSDLKNLILETKNQIAVQVNAAMTMMYWQIGNKINTEVLQDQRAEYGKKIIKNVAIELTQEFGNSFSEKNLRRMMKFALVFNDVQIVAPLVRQSPWTHHLIILGQAKRPEERLRFDYQRSLASAILDGSGPPINPRATKTARPQKATSIRGGQRR